MFETDVIKATMSASIIGTFLGVVHQTLVRFITHGEIDGGFVRGLSRGGTARSKTRRRRGE